MERDTLIAIPLFVFMGIMLQRSKIAEDLLVAMAQLFGPVPGGLGISVVFVGALLAATTGILGATVIAMGLISLPAMIRNNYSRPLATGTICAAGSLCAMPKTRKSAAPARVYPIPILANNAFMSC